MKLLTAALPGVIETIMAMVATVLVVAAIEPTPGLMVLGAVLAMTLSRSTLVDTWRGRLESVLVLPAIALLTAAVGLLLAWSPLAGAVAFTAAMFTSVWLRRFGATWQRIGTLVALPFVTLLIVPVHVGGASVWQVAAVSLLALVLVIAVRLLGGLVWHREVTPADQRALPRQGTLRPIPSTRIAIQLAVAVAAAFALGFLFFPTHWGWVVLTAYLVHAGNRGRADVVYKSGLRFLGAIAGSLGAISLAGVHLQGPPLVVVVIGAVAVGLVLRTVSYAFWALAVTLALTVLQGGTGGAPVELLPRVVAIVVGALCGIVASWFILPIRSVGVLRLRIANVLGGLDAMVSDGGPRPSIAPVDEVAAPFIALARVPFAPARWRWAGEWVSVLRAVHQRDISPSALPVLRKARKAMREPEQIGPALSELLAAL